MAVRPRGGNARGRRPCQPVPSHPVAASASDIEGIERVLIVVAHPDDCDFGCAATTARWTAAGIQVSYCIVTDGQAGGYDRSVPRDSVAGIRRADLRPLVNRLSPACLSRQLRRLHDIGVIKRVAGTYRYYLTRIGRAATAALCRVTQSVIIPALA